MSCTFCGNDSPAAARFCPRCGTPTNVGYLDVPVPAAVDWATVRQTKYARLLSMARGAAETDLVMEEITEHEADGVRALNLFLPDRTPAFSIAAVDRQPLFANGRWGPIQVRTSHPQFVAAANRLCREYYALTRMPARVVIPSPS